MSRSEPLTRHDLRLVPAAAAVWFAAWLVTGELLCWALLAAGFGAVGLLVALRRRAWAGGLASLAMVGAVLVSWLQLMVLNQGLVAELAGHKAIAEVTFTVSSDTRVHGWRGPVQPMAQTPVSITQVSVHGQSQRVRSPALLMSAGDGITKLQQIPVGAAGRAVVLITSPRPGERYVARVQLRGEVDLISDPPAPLKVINRLRRGLSAAMVQSAPEPAGLVPALVVGDTSALPSEVEDDFKATGLTHLTAVSGTNLTLLLAFALGGARTLGLHGPGLRLLGVCVVGFFVVLCRAEPSVLRAAAMGLVAMAATGASTRSSGVRALALAAFGLLLLDPWLARSWGFALSVSASAGILVWGGRWQRAMRSWAPGWLAEAVCIPLSAQLATQALVTALSGAISASGVAANALAGPFVGPVTILGIITALVSMVSSGLAAFVGQIAGLAAWPIILIARFLASQPSASWPWRSTPLALMTLTVVCLLVGLTLHRVLHRPRLTLGLLAIGLTVSWWQPVHPGWPGSWQMVACDVGQGDATVLRVGPATGLLVDTGDDPQAVLRCVRSLGVTHVPVVVITHAHTDHSGALIDVVETFAVGVVATPDVERVATQLETARAELGLVAPPQVIELLAGLDFQLGDVCWRTLGPSNPMPILTGDFGESAAENDQSAVAVAEVAGLRVLLTGDVEPAGQEALLGTGAEMSAHVLSLPHHGSAAQSADFFRASQASVAIASVGADNSYGHPASRTVRLAESMGMQVLRTDRSGSIAVSLTENDALSVRVQRR